MRLGKKEVRTKTAKGEGKARESERDRVRENVQDKWQSAKEMRLDNNREKFLWVLRKRFANK